VGCKICDEFDITEDFILQGNAEKRLFAGVTDVSGIFPWRWKHELICSDRSRSRAEGFYVMSCSMRVIPFFSKPGYLDGKWLLDGGFSAFWSVPDDADPAKVIRVTPASGASIADVKPDKYSDECFRWMDVFRLPSLEDILEQFRRGYHDGIRCRDRLIQKGLVPKLPSQGGGCRYEQWKQLLEKHAKIIWYDESKLRKQDLSQLLDRSKSVPLVTTNRKLLRKDAGLN
jgi:hypothetical protein